MKPILIILVNFIFALKLFASINGAGFTGGATSMEFEPMKSYGSNPEAYLSAVSSVYACPRPGDTQTTILHDIDPKNGKIICYVYDEDSTDPNHIYKQTAENERLFASESDSIDAIINDGTYKNLSIRTRFGNYEFNSSPGYTSDYIQVFNLSYLWDMNKSVQDFLQVLSMEDETGALSAARISLDSYSNPERIMSNILTGLITLNPDYFEADALVKENGAVALKDYALFGEASTTEYPSSDTLLKKISRAIIGETSETSVSVITLVNFIDKKFWGFYTYLIYNLKEAYISILGTLMLFGGGYALGRYGYRRIKSKVNKDQEADDKGKLASKSLDVFLIIGMFLVPISINNANIPDNFIYTKSNSSFHTTETSAEAEEMFSQSTLSSSTIRYFANLGSQWANVINDYALFSYLRFLESKQKAITASGLSQNEESIKKLYRDTFYLKKEYDFYINVCRVAFQPVLSSITIFNSVSKDAKESLLNNTINLTGTPIHENLGYSKINPMLCVKIEENIATSTKRILADYSRVSAEIEVSKAIVDNYSTRTAEQFNHYVDFMQFIGNNYGWISVAVVPPSFSLLFGDGKSVFAYDVAQKKIANNDGNNLSQANAGNDEERREITDDADGGWGVKLVSGVVSNTMWFILPGFSDIFKVVHEYIKDAAHLNSKTDKKAEDKGSLLRTVIGMFTSLGGLLVGVLKIALMIIKFFGAPLIYAFVLYVSLLIAVQIYTIMITTLTMIVIGGAITIKVCLYFMELLLYYFLTDAILFISIVTQKNEYFVKFLSKGMTITLLTPLLIVLSVYVFIFFYNLAKEMYGMLMNTIYEISKYQYATIYSETPEAEAMINSFITEVTIHSSQAFGEIVITIFALVIGTITIFKFKDWVFKIIGIDDNDFSAQMSEGINQKITGGINPVK